MSRALTYATSLDDVLHLAVERAAEIFNAAKAVLMLADEEGLLHIRAVYGIDAARLRAFREPLAETLSDRLQGILGKRPEECFLAVPLVVRGGTIGLLATVLPPDAPCGEEEEWLLSALADQAAVALETARVDEEVRRRLEERIRTLEGADAAREQAIGVLGHELRTPLHAIESYTGLLETEVLGSINEKQRHALARIRLSGRHLLALVENMVELARLNAGIVHVRCQPVRLAAVIEDAVALVRPDAESRRQSLELTVNTELFAWADVDRLRQVLVNLLSNAIKYTGPDGRIAVHTTTREADGRHRMEIAVSDTGPGIPADQREAIFQPYYRAGSGAAAGAGLGLAIARELVRRMDGEITVESELGRGSTFIVSLEAARDPTL